jgi:putrescine transport system substrate-binding protein
MGGFSAVSGGLTRRLALLAAGAAALAVASCGQQTAGGGAQAGGTLNVYNWSDYIDPALLEEFTKETGIKVVYDTFDNNEIVETKLTTGGSGYDIVAPSNQVVQRLIAAGVLEPFDFAKIPNRKNLWPEIASRMETFDPGLKHSIPYMWGTIGIGYNEAMIKERLGNAPVDSWSLVFDPATIAKVADCGVMMLDSGEEMFSIILNYMGKDPNSTNAQDYKEATDLMAKVRPSVRKFHSSEYINALAGGDICVAVGYSGDIFQAATRAEEAGGKVSIGYSIPKEGAQIWFDNFVIPNDAPNKEAAYKFIDFMYRPEVIARASNYVQYANANAPSKELLDPAVRDNPGIYPADAVIAKMFTPTVKEQELMREINRYWTTVRTGQ